MKQFFFNFQSYLFSSSHLSSVSYWTSADLLHSAPVSACSLVLDLPQHDLGHDHQHHHHQVHDHLIHQLQNQGVFFPAGVWVFPAGNLKNLLEILTKTLIIEQILWYLENLNKIFSQNRLKFNMEYIYNVSIVCGLDFQAHYLKIVLALDPNIF